MKRKNTRRADGRFTSTVDLGRDENGKRRRKVCYGQTQAQADKAADEIRQKLGRGLAVEHDKDAFSLWSAKWLTQQKLRVSAGWYTNCVQYVKYLDESIGDFELSKVRVSDVQDIVNRLAVKNPHTGKRSSKKLLEGVRNAARGVFDFAILNRIIEFNPGEHITIPREAAPAETRRAITDEEMQWVLNTPHRAQTAAMVALFAGLRRGELIALQWRDVDFENNTITVRQSVERTAANRFDIKGGAKTPAGSRVVDMPAKLVTFLEGVPRTSLFVTFRANGAMHTEMSFRRMWESYQYDLNKQYGDFGLMSDKPAQRSKFDPKHRPLPFVIQGFGLHDLRHTTASIMYFAGVDVLTASQQLGHKDPTTTLRIYTHLDQKFKRKNLKKLDRFLAGK